MASEIKPRLGKNLLAVSRGEFGIDSDEFYSLNSERTDERNGQCLIFFSTEVFTGTAMQLRFFPGLFLSNFSAFFLLVYPQHASSSSVSVATAHTTPSLRATRGRGSPPPSAGPVIPSPPSVQLPLAARRPRLRPVALARPTQVSPPVLCSPTFISPRRLVWVGPGRARARHPTRFAAALLRFLFPFSSAIFSLPLRPDQKERETERRGGAAAWRRPNRAT
jgi:hypothetical protein